MLVAFKEAHGRASPPIPAIPRCSSMGATLTSPSRAMTVRPAWSFTSKTVKWTRWLTRACRTWTMGAGITGSDHPGGVPSPFSDRGFEVSGQVVQPCTTIPHRQCEGAEQRSLQGETAQSIQSAHACALPELQSAEVTSARERGRDMDAVNDFEGLQAAEKVIVRGEAEGDKVNVVHRHRAEGGSPQKGGQGFMGKGNRVQVESLDPCAASPKNEGPEAAVFELFGAMRVIVGGEYGQSVHQGGIGGEGFQQLRATDSFKLGAGNDYGAK
ncbi:hypothetical protein K439DRAFT_1622428 [Ramaria rubella]|nr:hypothetical protein K439DRAFT_1622428 [Ramaria rubella]